MIQELPFRHIHLDFHTSPLIPNIGQHFDPETFIATLQRAHVNSIALFAKCHHGMSYYPTRLGVTHPHLEFDLFGSMVNACKQAGIRVVAYTTVTLDEYMATQHPEWRQVDEQGRLVGRAPLNADHFSWQWLCMNSPYLDYVAQHTQEMLECYPVDGVFYDIILQSPCLCRHCQEGMRTDGLNPGNLTDRERYSLQVADRCMARLSRVVWDHHPDLAVFFNSRLRFDTYARNSTRNEQQHYSHWEIESLASGEWGYSHFPIAVRYFQALTPKRAMTGHTGRFHTSWGDFGALKNQAALEYECFRLIASGCACTIGDQLAPNGTLDPAIYQRIGAVYEQIARKEAWCRDVTPQVEIGVMTAHTGDHGGLAKIDEGVMRMLLETHYQFEFLDAQSNFQKYPLLILPDDIRLTPALRDKLTAYLAQGGKLLLSYHSGLMQDRDEFGVDCGIAFQQNYEFTPSYIRAHDALQQGIEPMDHVMYEASAQVVAHDGTAALASVVKPYFNRTWEHFCSHQHTPPETITDIPAVTQRGNIIYIASAIFSGYIDYGYRPYREIVRNCIERLLPKKLICGNLPTTAETTLMKQESRLILHVLHYTPQRTAKKIDLLEEVIPLYERTISVKTEQCPSKIMLVPEQQELTFTWSDHYAHFTVPEIRGHQMVLIEQAA